MKGLKCIIHDATVKLNVERGLNYKVDFIRSLSEDEYKNGLVKILIPGRDGMLDETLWAWVTPEDKLKYNDDNFTGVIKAILCNAPLNFMNALCGYTEVEVKCQGEKMPVLHSEWVENNIINTTWYKELY